MRRRQRRDGEQVCWFQIRRGRLQGVDTLIETPLHSHPDPAAAKSAMQGWCLKEKVRIRFFKFTTNKQKSNWRFFSCVRFLFSHRISPHVSKVQRVGQVPARDAHQSFLFYRNTSSPFPHRSGPVFCWLLYFSKSFVNLLYRVQLAWLFR